MRLILLAGAETTAYRARWFDPATGEITEASEEPVPGGEQAFACPDGADRALLIERV